MACLRSMMSRRTSLFSRHCSLSLPFHVFHHNKDCAESDSPGPRRLRWESLSCLLQSQAHSLDRLWDERKHVSFARQVGSGFTLRYMSSRPEEVSYTVEGLGSVIEELAPEKTVEAVATQVSIMNEVAAAAADTSFPEKCVQYLIGGVHEYTGLNWWASIVLTAFLFSGPCLPIYINTRRRIRDLLVLNQRIQQIRKQINETSANDPKTIAKYLGVEQVLMKKGEAAMSSLMTGIFFYCFITVSFLYGISNMARKIPSFKSGGILWFADLSVPGGFYILPLALGFTCWFPGHVLNRPKNLIAETRRLLWCIFASVVFQSTFEFETAVFCFIVSSKLSTLALLLLVLRSQKIRKSPKLRRLLCLPPLQPGSSSGSASADSLSEPSKTYQRILSLKEMLNEKKKDKK